MKLPRRKYNPSNPIEIPDYEPRVVLVPPTIVVPDNKTHWQVVIACIALIVGASGMDIAKLHDWHEMMSMMFIGSFISHVGAVAGAYVGGRLFNTVWKDL